MVLKNAIPRLEESIKEANTHNTEQEVKFLYNELLTLDGIGSVFDWLFRKQIEFKTRYDEMSFVVIIYPKKIKLCQQKKIELVLTVN